MKFIFLWRKNLKSDGVLNFCGPPQSAGCPVTKDKKSHTKVITLSQFYSVSQSVISVSLTQLVIFLKFSPPANKIMCYTCLRVFAKSWGRVQRKAGSLQVIKTHSRMLHHHHHVADPLYCEGEHKLIFKLCSNYKDFAALHLVCDIWCRNGNQFATDFQFGSSSASFSTKLFDDIQSLLFPEKDIFQVFISSFALLMGGWVCRGVQRETSATIWLSTGCSRGESGEWQ